jgi:hypothetical protein
MRRSFVQRVLRYIKDCFRILNYRRPGDVIRDSWGTNSLAVGPKGPAAVIQTLFIAYDPCCLILISPPSFRWLPCKTLLHPSSLSLVYPSELHSQPMLTSLISVPWNHVAQIDILHNTLHICVFLCVCTVMYNTVSTDAVKYLQIKCNKLIGTYMQFL